MAHRALAAAFPVVVMIAVMVPWPVAAQTGVGDGDWVVPRTADGQPDLQGTWNNTTITPFERPARQADQAFLTEEEAVAAEQAALERRARANAPSTPRTEPLPAGGSTGSVNQFWFGPRYQIVGSRRTSLVIDPPDGRVPLRSEAEVRRDFLVEHRADAIENMSVYSRCITRGVPGTMFPQAYNNGYQILQVPGYVVIRAEMMHIRVIPLDGAPHLDERIRGWMGDSRGHWEGDTLVVETTNFLRETSFRAGVTTPELRLTERFTRVSDGTLLYDVTVEDPGAWDRPWSYRLPMVKSEFPMFEYACHEGNYSMDAMLGGAQAADKAEGGQ